jgi:hypothetical protein
LFSWKGKDKKTIEEREKRFFKKQTKSTKKATKTFSVLRTVLCERKIVCFTTAEKGFTGMCSYLKKKPSDATT